MSLIDLYTGAAATSYVGRVRLNQTGITSATQDGTSTDAPLTRGVNLMDAFRRSAGGDPASDAMQKEFTRNPAGAFKYAGAGKIPGTGESEDDQKNLTRWTSKALQFAFTDPGITREGGVAGSLFSLYKNRIRANHKYTPAATGTFARFNVQLPTAFQKDRATRGTPAPSPSGLNG
jgi:hypothetical protein